MSTIKLPKILLYIGIIHGNPIMKAEFILKGREKKNTENLTKMTFS